jgi:hypothetical protein
VQNFFLILAAQAPEQFFFTRSRSGCAQKKPLPGTHFFYLPDPVRARVNFFSIGSGRLASAPGKIFFIRLLCARPWCKKSLYGKIFFLFARAARALG